jgi:hypothetical protein
MASKLGYIGQQPERWRKQWKAGRCSSYRSCKGTCSKRVLQQYKLSHAETGTYLCLRLSQPCSTDCTISADNFAIRHLSVVPDIEKLCSVAYFVKERQASCCWVESPSYDCMISSQLGWRIGKWTRTFWRSDLGRSVLSTTCQLNLSCAAEIHSIHS